MQQELITKLEDVVDLIHKTMVNPDVELSYHIPDVAMTAENAKGSGDPYVELTYISNGTHAMKQKIPIKHHYLKKSAQEIANLVTFYIEQFIEQIDSVEYGAQ